MTAPAAGPSCQVSSPLSNSGAWQYRLSPWPATVVTFAAVSIFRIAWLK